MMEITAAVAGSRGGLYMAIKFSDMQYKRPDLQKLKEKLASVTGAFSKAASFEEAERLMLEFDRESGHFTSMCTLALIRHQMNTEDKFYEAETEYFDEVVPEAQESLQAWTLEFIKTPFRKEFEDKYGRLLFVNAEMGLKTFSPAIISELQSENVLITEYVRLLASAQIPYEGEVYTISQLSPMKQQNDDRRRRAAWEAEGKFYESVGERLDSLYDELTALRTAMAKKMGYVSYTQMGYYRMTRNCYDKEDVERFRDAVVKYIVPLAESIFKKQARRMGFDYPMSYADAALEFRSGNPKPRGTADDILKQAGKFYAELSAETKEFIEFMYSGELLDVLSRKGKAGGGFCTEIADYAAPFIFANFNGTQGDVEVMTHEAGHAFAAYIARDIVPGDLRTPSMESAEIHSMSMEFFARPWAEGFFGDDTEKFLYSHLASALKFIPYGTMVDHFQHLMYAKPELKPSDRHGVWRELMTIYMPWIALDDGTPFYSDARAWQRQSHIYEVPFYYIDYCLAQAVALQFWALADIDRDGAWQAYMRLIRCAGKKTFSELVEVAGLKSPFGDEGLKEVCEAAERRLDAFDQSKLI